MTASAEHPVRADEAPVDRDGLRVLVVDDHELVARGMQIFLSAHGWDAEVVVGATVDAAVRRVRRWRPQCVLLGLHPTSAAGRSVGLIRPLVATGAQVVVLSAERRRRVLAECVEAGAAGWISTRASFDELEVALTRLVVGEPILGRTDRAVLLDDLRSERAKARHVIARIEQLTLRERLVLGALIDGLTAEEIAAAHFVALTTVRTQIRAVLQKLGVRSQLAAVAFASAHRALLTPQIGEVRERRRVSPARSWTDGQSAGRYVQVRSSSKS